MREVPEKDWKLFRARVPEWQEAYMTRLCEEYVALLTSDRKGSDRFRALEKRIRKDQKKTSVVVDMRRSMMIEDIVNLIVEDVITLEDLDGFTEETIETVRMWARI